MSAHMTNLITFVFFSYRSTAVYGGAGVADQIGDLKRGTHIAVATPGKSLREILFTSLLTII